MVNYPKNILKVQFVTLKINCYSLFTRSLYTDKEAKIKIDDVR